MALESELVTVLQTVIPRVYPDSAPAKTALPYCVYHQIGGEAPTFLDNAVPSKRNALIQIDIYYATRGAAKTAMLAVESALTLATSFQARPVGAMRGTLDDESDIRGASQDFSVWADR